MRSFKLAAGAIVAVGLWCAAAPAAAQSGQHFSAERSSAHRGDMRLAGDDWSPQIRGDRDRRAEDRDDREQGRRDQRRYGGFAGGYLFGDYDSPRTYDLRDSGFFSGRDAVRTADGHVRYDYDRGYPYDFYRMQAASGEVARSPRCSIERNVRVCRD